MEEPFVDHATYIRVPMDAPTVSAAIAMAKVDDIVILEPGAYEESIVIDKDIHLMGSDTPSGELVSELYSVQGSALILDGMCRVQVSNLRVRATAAFGLNFAVEIRGTGNRSVLDNV